MNRAWHLCGEDRGKMLLASGELKEIERSKRVNTSDFSFVVTFSTYDCLKCAERDCIPTMFETEEEPILA
jgi:hypothetical protein